ncbi:MAG: hypothetical protein ACE5LU_27735 [Anaerolineae bacterium]
MQRKFTLLVGVLIAGLVLAACAPAATPEAIRETVEVEVTRVVEKEVVKEVRIIVTPTPMPTPAAAPPPAVAIDETKVQDVIGTLKLVAAEYVDAVKDGEVIDQGEYEESRIFIEAAEDKYKDVLGQIGQANPSAGPAILENIEKAEKLINEKGSVDEVLRLVQQGIDSLSQFVTIKVDPRIAGVVDAVQIADSEMNEKGGEKVVGDYRIGVVAEAAEPFTIPAPTPCGWMCSRPRTAVMRTTRKL